MFEKQNMLTTNQHFKISQIKISKLQNSKFQKFEIQNFEKYKFQKFIVCLKSTMLKFEISNIKLPFVFINTQNCTCSNYTARLPFWSTNNT